MASCKIEATLNRPTQSTYLILVDFKAVFASISETILLRKLIQLGVLAKGLSLLQDRVTLLLFPIPTKRRCDSRNAIMSIFITFTRPIDDLFLRIKQWHFS